MSKNLKENEEFNPSMLYFSMLALWFKELDKESRNKEFIYFTIYPYSQIYNKFLIKNKDIEYKNINNLNVLEDILKELNLEYSTLKEILDETKYNDEINKDMYQASTFNIKSVPSIVLRNGKTYMGSRTKEGYEKIIAEAKEI